MSKEEYIKEKELHNQLKAIPTEERMDLIDLIKTHVCKTTCKDGIHGTGFFCYILNGSGNFLTSFITNNHVLIIDDIKPVL